jgi:hypothetical protein
MIRWLERARSELSIRLSAVVIKTRLNDRATLRGLRRMSMVIVHTFRSLQDTFEARASEWMLTGVVLSLAVVFTLNEGMFYRESFEGLRSILNSRFGWALILAVVGLVRLSVLTINGSYWRTPHLRSLTAFLSAGVWFLFCAGFARNGSVMLAIMPWVFMLDAYNAKRAGREAGQSEFFQRHRRQKQDTLNAGMARGAQR